MFSSTEQFVTILASGLFFGFCMKKRFKHIFHILLFFPRYLFLQEIYWSNCLDRYVSLNFRLFMFFFPKKMSVSISCICTISLHYKFFLQKVNLNIFRYYLGIHNFGQSWHLYGFVLLVSSYGKNRFFVFLFCNKMPACISRICTVSL